MAGPDLDRLRRRLPPVPLTRFAPSPTGSLHLGHAVNAIFVWGLARALGGRVLLRIEDHDRGRSREEYDRALLEDLAWLGLEADEGPAKVRCARAAPARRRATSTPATAPGRISGGVHVPAAAASAASQRDEAAGCGSSWGWSAERVLGEAAFHGGLLPRARHLKPGDLAALFTPPHAAS